jgi:hypothetical protein
MLATKVGRPTINKLVKYILNCSPALSLEGVRKMKHKREKRLARSKLLMGQEETSQYRLLKTLFII